MRRKCEPLYEGDPHETCGVMFDDLYRMAVCPHVLLAGGDTVGIGPKANTPGTSIPQLPEHLWT